MSAEIRRTPDSIDVRTPAPRIRWQSLVILSWLPFIIAGGVALYVTGTSFGPMASQGGGMVLAAVFFVGFSLLVFFGCLAGALAGIYGLSGTEHVYADRNGIVVNQELWGLRLSNRFPPYRIRRVRVNVPPAQQSNWSPPPSRVIFDTPGRVQGFGSSLTAEEAAEVAGTISELVDEGNAVQEQASED
jgi:hypothetical protein